MKLKTTISCIDGTSHTVICDLEKGEDVQVSENCLVKLKRFDEIPHPVVHVMIPLSQIKMAISYPIPSDSSNPSDKED